MPKPSYPYEVESNIQGIPCIIGISSYVNVPGNPYTWDSDVDYYGYEEMDWGVMDRKGYAAPWLEKKLNDGDRDRIEREISEFFADLNSNYDPY